MIRIAIIIFSLLVALASSILFFEKLDLNIPTIIPNNEALLNRAENISDINKKISLTEQAIEISPNNALNYVFLARYEALKSNAITPDVSNNLLESYKISKFDRNTTETRLGFIFRNWDLIGDNIHVLAIEEATMFATGSYGNKYLSKLKEICSPNANIIIDNALISGRFYREDLQSRKDKLKN